ncbi:MAG TPA: class I SAM-dependent methyltransferase [Terriglobales bacterium]|nr:class I SAM-dependent methyltransferase [Terriglobales bacterium]
MNDFYDQLAPLYHLIFEDWEASIVRQAEQLTQIIKGEWSTGIERVLDVSCGIGTQAIGLARAGFRVTASDISAGAIARAVREAKARKLDIAFSVCDMCEAHQHDDSDFDLVICCDNSIPHLLTDDDILTALRQMHDCLRPGGGCLITMRNYDQETRGIGLLKPHGVRDLGDTRYVIFQVWDFDKDQYDLTIYFVEEDRTSKSVKTHALRTRYYAISPTRVVALMKQAGFAEVKRWDDVFYQPVLVGTKRR